VLVRVVVRDAHGEPVANLAKENFQLFDNRKPQTITAFSVETPESRTPPAVSGQAESGEIADRAAKTTNNLPSRFLAIVFDDVHLQIGDAVTVRSAALRLFDVLRPSDRVAIYSTSGQVTQEFTADHELLKKALVQIIPRPVGGLPYHDCPEVTFYQADLIENRHDDQALGAAVEDAIQCAYNGDRTHMQDALSLARTSSVRALTRGESESGYANRHIEDVLGRLAAMPGQRILVFASPGYLLSRLTSDASGIIDRANRSNIVIDSLDARGLYTPDVSGDLADPPADSIRASGYKAMYRVSAQMADSEILQEFADGTGGTYFHNRNDLDEGFREAVGAPAVSYLLAFSPQNLKLDGRYHNLTVKLAGKSPYKIQARRGYYAPHTLSNPEETAKEEIREALFSQEQMSDVPVAMQTQFFKKDAENARVAVLARVDLKSMAFRKADGRNRDELTVVTGLFDENGNYVTGGVKTIQMRLFDATYERLSRSGLTVKSSFDVKPGSYLVRLVVRDSEGEKMAAQNGAVVIPF
jgi:VWFA-related protein